MLQVNFWDRATTQCSTIFIMPFRIGSRTTVLQPPSCATVCRPWTIISSLTTTPVTGKWLTALLTKRSLAIDHILHTPPRSAAALCHTLCLFLLIDDNRLQSFRYLSELYPAMKQHMRRNSRYLSVLPSDWRRAPRQPLYAVMQTLSVMAAAMKDCDARNGPSLPTRILHCSATAAQRSGCVHTRSQQPWFRP